MKQFFNEIFSEYEKKLSELFTVYDDQEIEQLYKLMMKMYDGIEHFEKSMNHEEI